MNTKKITIAIGFVLALVTIWFGRIAWRAHHNLVTLHVRNAPLAEVVRQLERQTKERVRLDQKLDAKVSLDVENTPLTNVFDLLADLAGARWGKTYAVYDNAGALRRLEPVFRGDAKLDEAGWTNLAPHIAQADFPGIDSFPGGPRKVIMASPDGSDSNGAHTVLSDEDVQKLIPESLRDKVNIPHGSDGAVRTVTATVDGSGSNRVIRVSTNGVIVAKNGPDGGPGSTMRSMTVRRIAGPGGITTTMSDGEGRMKITRTAPDGTVIKEDQWSTERLVMDSILTSRLGEAVPAKATAEAAAQTARKVRGRYVTYYMLEKPPIAGDAGMGRLVRSMSQRKFSEGGTNNPLANGDIRGRIAAEARQRRFEELSKSPEQQVQRARQKQEAQSEK